MSVVQKGRMTSPVHVHVDEQTPVHVHIKQPKKVTVNGNDNDATKSRLSKNDAANQKQRGRATAKAREGSPPAAPPAADWVRPPIKTSTNKAGKFAWQGASHRLEMSNYGRSPSPLRRDDLSADEDDRAQGRVVQYDKKIDSLMADVDELKTEVELQKTRREVEQRDEMLMTSQQILEEQQQQMRDYQMDLEATEAENRRLRQRADAFRDETELNRSARATLLAEQDRLMKKLIEVEMNGQSAAQQVAALKDTIRRLRHESQMATADSAMLSKQKELVMERLRVFEDGNRELRALLHSRHEEEAANLRLMEQRDLLLKKLSEADIISQQVNYKLVEKDRMLDELRLQLNSQREENVGMAGLQVSLESNRAHLQKQLRQKDADCNRMAVQIRTLESEIAQGKIEIEHLQGLLLAAKDKATRDKEALKKATRAQKERATRSEDTVDQLRAQLLEREAIVGDMRGEVEGTRALCDKLTKERNQAVADITDMRRRVSELESALERQEADSRTKHEVNVAKLQEKTSESTALKMDVERLKITVTSTEDKLAQAEREIDRLKSSLRQCESLIDEYRSQVNQSRRDLNDSYVQLEEQKLQTSRASHEGELELEKVRVHLQARLDELEPLPELLKNTELKLQAAQEQLAMIDRRNTDNLKTIGEQQAKQRHGSGSSQLSHQADQLEQSRARQHAAEDERVHLNTRLDASERKSQEAEEKIRDLQAALNKKDEALQLANTRLEERSRDNAALSRQLEAAIADTSRQVEQNKERAAAKERVLQSRILDLESQISQLRAEVSRAKRDKEEAERKFSSKLYDLKDRLEQSASTNRSMQSYVHFLKSSYANVFGDGFATTNGGGAVSPARNTFH